VFEIILMLFDSHSHLKDVSNEALKKLVIFSNEIKVLHKLNINRQKKRETWYDCSTSKKTQQPSICFMFKRSLSSLFRIKETSYTIATDGIESSKWKYHTLWELCSFSPQKSPATHYPGLSEGTCSENSNYFISWMSQSWYRPRNLLM
jgi:hypothetical protein